MLKKRVSIIDRRRDLDKAPFDAHWAGPHVPIVLALPGLLRYVQHHVLEPETTEPPVDGISEVVFDAPAEQPSNTHFSAVQEEDELAFVSGVTAMPIRETASRDAAYQVWVIRPDVPVDVADYPGDVLVDVRDESQPVMTRARLTTEAAPPKALVSCGFADLDDARRAYERLTASRRPGERVVLTESLRVDGGAV